MFCLAVMTGKDRKGRSFTGYTACRNIDSLHKEMNRLTRISASQYTEMLNCYLFLVRNCVCIYDFPSLKRFKHPAGSKIYLLVSSNMEANKVWRHAKFLILAEGFLLSSQLGHSKNTREEVCQQVQYRMLTRNIVRGTCLGPFRSDKLPVPQDSETAALTGFVRPDTHTPVSQDKTRQP